MNDTATLEFPPLEASEPVARASELATAPPAALDLKKIDLTDVALAQFGDWKKSTAEVRANLSTLALDLSTQAKVDEAKSLRFRLIGQPRADARKVSKELKSKLAKVSKDIGAAEEAIVAAWDEAETLITPQIEARQAEFDTAKAAREQAEAERIELHRLSIAAVKHYAVLAAAPDMTAARITRGLVTLTQMTFGPEYEEFCDAISAARDATMITMHALHGQAVARETAAAELEAQRAENARLAAELAEQKALQDAREADLKRQADELAARTASAAPPTLALVPPPAPEPVVSLAQDVVAQNHVQPQPSFSNGFQLGDAAVSGQAEESGLSPADAACPRDVEGVEEVEQATLRLSDISDRLGFIVGERLLQRLGFEATAVKSSRLYRPSVFPAICDALVVSIQASRGAA